jgi:hypothetical protein
VFSEPLFIKVSSTPWYIFVGFALLYVTFDLVLVRWLKLGDLAWKRAEYFWLGSAILGLLGASAQAGRFVGMNYARNTESALQAAYSDVRGVLKSGIDGMVCRSYQPSPLNQDSFDLIDREYKALCDRFRELFAKLPADMPDSTPSLAELGFVLPRGQGNIVGPYINMLDARAKWYEDIRRDVARWRANSAQGDLEISLMILSPLLISLALALRLAKVTGELANAKRARNLTRHAADSARD